MVSIIHVDPNDIPVYHLVTDIFPIFIYLFPYPFGNYDFMTLMGQEIITSSDHPLLFTIDLWAKSFCCP
jgi:hypothetical protein